MIPPPVTHTKFRLFPLYSDKFRRFLLQSHRLRSPNDSSSSHTYKIQTIPPLFRQIQTIPPIVVQTKKSKRFLLQSHIQNSDYSFRRFLLQSHRLRNPNDSSSSSHTYKIQTIPPLLRQIQTIAPIVAQTKIQTIPPSSHTYKIQTIPPVVKQRYSNDSYSKHTTTTRRRDLTQLTNDNRQNTLH